MRKAMRHRMTIYHAQSIHTGEVPERLPYPVRQTGKGGSPPPRGALFKHNFKFLIVRAEASAFVLVLLRLFCGSR